MKMRLKLLQDYLKQEKISAVYLTHYDINLQYFTGFKPSYGFLEIKRDSAKLYLTTLDGKPKIPGVKIVQLDKNTLKKLKSKKSLKFGINKAKMNVDFYEKLKKIFSKAKFIDIGKELAKLRSIKDKQEIALIRKACQITDYAFNELVKHIHKLKTEQGVANFLESKIKEKNAELAFPTIVAMGKNSAVPHHITSGKKLGKGFLLLDFGAKFNGYCADMSRMLYLGKPSKQELKMYTLLLDLQQGALKMAKIGSKYADLDKYVRKGLGKYSSYFIHSLGHGIGLEVHEAPRLAPESKDEIVKNNVHTIEPGVYFPGKYGIRIEDTVCNGVRLTKSSKKLKIIKVR